MRAVADRVADDELFLRLRFGPRRHRLQADRLALRQWPNARMVEDEESEFRAAMNEFVATVTEAVNLASLVRHVVALFEEARQGLESLAYPIDVAISASPSQLSLKSAILYRGLDRAQTHRELSGRPAYARAERWSRYRRRECGGMSVPVRASYGGLLDGTGFSAAVRGRSVHQGRYL